MVNKSTLCLKKNYFISISHLDRNCNNIYFSPSRFEYRALFSRETAKIGIDRPINALNESTNKAIEQHNTFSTQQAHYLVYEFHSIVIIFLRHRRCVVP
jgi:hypothetical protein